MIMEKEYGPANIRKFLRHELDGYLSGRGSEQRHEPPLALRQREPYVWYNKGSLVMYALRDYIGEDRLNAALRGFLAALRAATPAEMQYPITDMFKSITLFDNKAVSAVWSPAPNNQYRTRAGIDPYNKLIDRKPAHNWVDVAKK